MRDEELRELRENLRRLIQPHLRDSEPLRRVVEGLGRLLLDEVRRAETGDGEPEGAESSRVPEVREQRTVAVGDAEEGRPSRNQASEPIVRGTVPLQLGEQTIDVAVADTHDELHSVRASLESDERDDEALDDASGNATDEPIDLELIEQRCRLKAESCRVYIDRRAAMMDGDEREQQVIRRVDEMIAQARAMPGCFLWVFLRERSQPDDETLRSVGRCYDALADAVAALREVHALGGRVDDDHMAEAMELAAESHSALRVALMWTWQSGRDVDQKEVHHWLRREAMIRQIYLPRYMKLGDPADPARADAVGEEARRLLARVQRRARRLKQIDEEFKKIRYHVRQAQRNDDEQARHDYRKIGEAVDALLEASVVPTDPRFRQAITPHIVESLPGDIPMSAWAVEVMDRVRDWHRADAEADRDDEAAGSERAWSQQVHEVRALLAGRRVVVVGGEPRPEAEERIGEAFDLSGVTWARLNEHGSSEPMRAPIARPETALVLVLIKLAGHQHADDAVAWSREHGKPCVFLKAGYNPEQIADAVLQQASEQLREMRSVSR